MQQENHSGSPILFAWADLSDIPQIQDLIREVAPIAFQKAGSLKEIERWLGSNASHPVLESRISAEQTKVLLAKQHGQLIASGYLQQQAADMPDHGYIGGVYCRVRGQGFGGALVSQLLAEADRVGYQQVTMTIGVDNHIMQHLARKIGFRPQPAHLDRAGFFSALFADWILEINRAGAYSPSPW